MFCAYRVQMTESEAGWGQRPDGYIYAIEREKLEQRLKQNDASKCYECYSFASSDIDIVRITSEFAEQIAKAQYGSIWTMRNTDPGDLGKLSDYKGTLGKMSEVTA